MTTEFSTEGIINLFPNDAGNLQRQEAFTNAVLTQLIYMGDDEETGEPVYSTVTSLMVRDVDMETPLKELAKRLMQ